MMLNMEGRSANIRCSFTACACRELIRQHKAEKSTIDLLAAGELRVVSIRCIVAQMHFLGVEGLAESASVAKSGKEAERPRDITWAPSIRKLWNRHKART